jgi:hypothetical protein
MRRFVLRVADALVTLAFMASAGIGCALLLPRIFAVDDPDRPTGSTMSGVGWAFIGLIVGAIGAAISRRVLAEKWPRTRLTNRFDKPSE